MGNLEQIKRSEKQEDISMIGIITFHASHNCGSMLQAYALQYVLKNRFGQDSEIINFSNKGQQQMYQAFWPVTGVKTLVKDAIWATVLPQINAQRMAYEKFSNKNFRLSAKQFTENAELVSIDGFYDKIITGSDQVWNICCMDADDAYYLNFAKKSKRYAYAVSFGANNAFKLDNKYITLAKRFNKISVREHNAQKWVRESLNLDVPVTLDPTMLLTREEWEKCIDIGEKPLIKEKYIFYYCFSISQEIEKFLKFVSQKTKMPVFFLEPKEWALRMCWRNNIKLVRHYGPEAFLNLMANANLIFTTSFHGTAFSTIFRKNFWYIDSGHNDLDKDDRAVSFLKQLGLLDRYRTIENLLNQDLFDEPDYFTVEENLKPLQKLSFSYLESTVNE